MSKQPGRPGSVGRAETVGGPKSLGRPETLGRPESLGRSENLGSAMSKGMSQASYGLSVAFGFVAIVIGCWWIGRQIDVRLGLEPWAQVVGTVVGWVLGVVAVYYAAQRQEK